MLTLGNTLIATRSRRLPFARDLQRAIRGRRAAARWPVALLAAATLVGWLAAL